MLQCEHLAQREEAPGTQVAKLREYARMILPSTATLVPSMLRISDLHLPR